METDTDTIKIARFPCGFSHKKENEQAEIAIPESRLPLRFNFAIEKCLWKISLSTLY
jgi:hypothetical protein